MKIIVAEFEAYYSGRGDTHLPRAVRSIIVKNDGAVSIHNDKGNKPLNYMGAGCVLTESFDGEYLVWSFDSRGENLTIKVFEKFTEWEGQLDDGGVGLVRDGTENQLQEWLSLHPETFGEGWVFLEREFKTGVGGLDLLMMDSDNVPVAVEVKRTASPNSVYQVIRYVDSLKDQPNFENVYGVVAAVDLRPNMLTLAGKKNIQTVQVPVNWRSLN